MLICFTAQRSQEGRGSYHSLLRTAAARRAWRGSMRRGRRFHMKKKPLKAFLDVVLTPDWLFFWARMRGVAH